MIARAGLSHREIDKMGIHTLPSRILFFDEVPVEKDALIGKLDGGFRALLDALNTEPIVTTAALWWPAHPIFSRRAVSARTSAYPRRWPVVAEEIRNRL
ncbi:MAG: hypothetical protein LGL72_06495 [Acidibrevibacterium sp.]|uniref:hypothetical protein n=1 Tax=Acidibrevibacterium fodinaquatile TaxID=1969806 RepID=UPI0023A87613|nr:hypothetical protein [Acidibrevibacterium fodinaquatile]MCA7119046.1 hypothetical protein [Acidibrevibacterium fodinaquatile]